MGLQSINILESIHCGSVLANAIERVTRSPESRNETKAWHLRDQYIAMRTEARKIRSSSILAKQ